MKETIRDDTGRGYLLEWHESSAHWHGGVLWGGAEVAYVNCLPLGDALKIGDLHVSHEVQVSFPLMFQWLPLVRIFPRKRNFRRHGIGAGLLRATLARAKAKGFREVFGDIAAADLAEFPGLLDWYERFGFEVSESGNGPMIRLII